MAQSTKQVGNNLTIDHGNSRVKVALWTDASTLPGSESSAARVAGDRACVLSACYRRFTPSDLEALFKAHRIDSAIWCSVAGGDTALLQSLHTLCANVIELTADTPTPLVIDYATPQTLGVDRIAAAVGAYTLDGACGNELLVADIGTAITYDRVTAQGDYLGGNIAPGIYMRLRALNHYTARLPMVSTSGRVRMWGRDTEGALRAGAVNGVVAELEYYRGQLGDNAQVIMTGGASPLVQSRLSFRPQVILDLVSRGLDAIVLYNAGLLTPATDDIND